MQHNESLLQRDGSPLGRSFLLWLKRFLIIAVGITLFIQHNILKQYYASNFASKKLEGSYCTNQKQMEETCIFNK